MKFLINTEVKLVKINLRNGSNRTRHEFFVIKTAAQTLTKCTNIELSWIEYFCCTIQVRQHNGGPDLTTNQRIDSNCTRVKTNKRKFTRLEPFKHCLQMHLECSKGILKVLFKLTSNLYLLTSIHKIKHAGVWQAGLARPRTPVGRIRCGVAAPYRADDCLLTKVINTH